MVLDSAEQALSKSCCSGVAECAQGPLSLKQEQSAWAGGGGAGGWAAETFLLELCREAAAPALRVDY